MKDPFFFSTFCYVINPVLGMVKFLLYPFQKAVLYQFMLNRFNIILKFRQAGITELISLYCLWLAMYHPNKKINIISIKDTVAKKVLKKIKFMYKNLPSYLQEPIINGRVGEFGSVSTYRVCKWFCNRIYSNLWPSWSFWIFVIVGDWWGSNCKMGFNYLGISFPYSIDRWCGYSKLMYHGWHSDNR